MLKLFDMAYMCILVLCGLIFLVVFKNLKSKPLSLPRAKSVPILGSLPYMTFDLAKDLTILGSDLGQLYLLPLGFGQEALVLNSAEVIREAFHIESFSGRPLTTTSKVVIAGGQTSILCATERDKTCKDARSTIFKGLKKVCNEENNFYSTSLSEACEFLVQILLTVAGKAVDTKPLVQIVSSQISAMVCFGRKICANDDFLENCMKPAVAFIQASERHILWELFPSISFLSRSRKIDMSKNYEKYLLYMTSVCNHYESQPERFCLFDHIVSRGLFDKENIAPVISDIFMPGFVTISENLPWLLLIVSIRKDVQLKVHQELHKFKNGHVNSLHAPFTYACIMEALRMRPIIFFGLCHSTTADVEFMGHLIPSGTLVIPNYASAAGNNDIFQDANNFDPERFLANPDQKLEKALTFSTGLRRCPGDVLAKQELFALFVSIMQNFEVKLAPSSTLNFLEKDRKGKVKEHKLIFTEL